MTQSQNYVVSLDWKSLQKEQHGTCSVLRVVGPICIHCRRKYKKLVWSKPQTLFLLETKLNASLRRRVSVLLRVGVRGGGCGGGTRAVGVLADEPQHVLPERQLGAARHVAHVGLQGQQEVSVLVREQLLLLEPGPLGRPRPLALLASTGTERERARNNPRVRFLIRNIRVQNDKVSDRL